jgi:hypothetical protein
MNRNNKAQMDELRAMGVSEEDISVIECGGYWSSFGLYCCLCTAGLSCIPYCCCYHNRITTIILKASFSEAQRQAASPSSMGQQHHVANARAATPPSQQNENDAVRPAQVVAIDD